jgi:serine protease AprX
MALTLVASAHPAFAGDRAAATRSMAKQQVADVLADLDGDKLFESLERKLVKAPAHQPMSVIVRYKAGAERAAAQLGGCVTCRLDGGRTVVAQLTPTQVRRLAAEGAVASVEENFAVWPTRDTANASFGVTKVSADFGLTGDMDGDPNHYSPQDLTIAVLDTGIDARHPDFANGKVIAWKDFVNDRTEPYDDEGHGTHVASIAAGAVVNGVGGVAPGASLVGVKVLPAHGPGTGEDVLAGVEWCIENRARLGIDVINMSLSTDKPSDGRDALSEAVDRAVAAGIVVCVAAGNEGPGPRTIGSPSAARSIITVGNMVDLGKGGFVLNASSSRGPTLDGRVKPDLCGPGTQISAAQANSDGYIRLTGTSMSCPFVAGVAALMLQANPSLTPGDVKRIMKETAVHFGAPGENNDYGAGRLDGYAAIATAGGNRGTAPEAPDHLFGQGALKASADSFVWQLPIDDTRFPIAVALIILDPEADFDLYVYDPDRKLVAASNFGGRRQETVSFVPEKTGTYLIQVHSFRGSGTYLLDVSAGSSVR